jgi:23S rRNA pseudouridine1911/1915/1917 synthase
MTSDHNAPIGPWPRIERAGPVHKTTEVEVRSWCVHEDSDLLVFEKDGKLPCHPAKDGPFSSLASAVREVYSLPAAHLVFRLDRETSGLVVFAKHEAAARRLQKAAERKLYRKTYLALLEGELSAPATVNRPLGRDWASPVSAKNTVVAEGEGQLAITHFQPLRSRTATTLAAVVTETGRKHQIRAHAAWLSHPLIGDKIYGPDARLFLEFIDRGWTPALKARLRLERQALHCARIDLRLMGIDLVLHSPWPRDLADFCRSELGWTDGGRGESEGWLTSETPALRL